MALLFRGLVSWKLLVLDVLLWKPSVGWAAVGESGFSGFSGSQCLECVLRCSWSEGPGAVEDVMSPRDAKVQYFDMPCQPVWSRKAFGER